MDVNINEVKIYLPL